MSDVWTHLQCAACWNAKHPAKKVMKGADSQAAPCCFCGKPTTSGIYVRHDPAELNCEHRKDQ